jgi:hypothetical protein
LRTVSCGASETECYRIRRYSAELRPTVGGGRRSIIVIGRKETSQYRLLGIDACYVKFSLQHDSADEYERAEGQGLGVDDSCGLVSWHLYAS